MADRIQFQRRDKDFGHALSTDTFPKEKPAPMSSEDIRREVKKLEQEIEHKLSTYSNLSEKIEQWCNEDEGTNSGSFGTTKDTISPISSLDELELLLKRLTEYNKEMNEHNTSTSILQHHRSKLADYTQEFRRLKSTVSEAWDRAQLLRGRKYSPLPERSINMDKLIRERNSIHNSSAMANDLISQAQLTKEQLDEQNRIISGSTTKLKGVGRQLPTLNSLMNKIKMKRNKNNLILAGFTATCICFLLWYWWTS